MKITIYELLGLIKDGKAPKRIKDVATGRIYNYDDAWKDYGNEDNEYYLMDQVRIIDWLEFEIEIIEEVEDKEYEDIDIINGDYIVPNTPATENEAYIMACFLAHEQIINALIRNQKYILERLDKNEKNINE